MMFTLLLLSMGHSHADCPDLGTATAQANDALVAARLEETQAALQRAEAAFSCGVPPTKEAIARFWLAEAALASVGGRAQDAQDAWQAAARLAPELWEPRYGPELRAQRDAAVAGMGQGHGTVCVDPLPEKHQMLVDGAAQPNPVTTSEGLHIVQVARHEVVNGKVVLLGADENMLVRPVINTPAEGRSRRGRVAWIAGGGLGLAAGAGLLVVAGGQDARMDETLAGWRTGDLSTADAGAEVDRRWTLQQAAGGAGYALTVLGLASVGVGIAW